MRGLYQVFFKEITAPDEVKKEIAWVKATSEADAQRQVGENLDTSIYEVMSAVYNPDEWRIQANDFTIGFRHPCA